MSSEHVTPPKPSQPLDSRTRDLRRPGSPSDQLRARPTTDTFDPERAGGEGASPLVIGRYVIESELGRGGMGVVYRARDPLLHRTVALKLLPSLHLASADAQRRFRIEAEATARLHHPHIVQIHELGTHQDATGTVVPFLVLEYVAGGTLSQYLHGRSLPPREAATLVEQLAQAIQHAHEQHIVHRDLKPSNILLAGEPAATAPGDSGRFRDPARPPMPKITDFGLALRLEETNRLTLSGTAMGTPAYMAPEQAAGKTHDTGPAVDVYSLGAILYQCLTGRPPFDSGDTLLCLNLLLHDEPLPPSRLSASVPRDLETICLKCLEKEAKKRYRSAAALADDLQAYLDGQPIAARPVGRLERGWRWCRRRPLVAGLLAALVLSTLLGVAGITWKYLDAEQQRFEAFDARKQAEDRAAEAARQKTAAEKHKHAAEIESQRASRAADEALRLAYRLSLSQVHRDWRECQIDQARQALADCPPALRGWEHAYLERLVDSNQRVFPRPALSSLARSADGRYFAVGQLGGVAIFDATSLQQIRQLDLPGGHNVKVAFHPDGSRLALTRELLRDGRLGSGQVQLWNWRQAKRLYATPDSDYGRCLDFSPDGERLLCVTSGPGLTMLATETGKVLWSEKYPPQEACVCACFTPDGKKLVSSGPQVGSRMVLRLRDVATGAVERNLETFHFQLIGTLAFSRDGRWLATGCVGGEVHLWDWSNQKLERVRRHHKSIVSGLAFDAHGERLVSCGHDRQVVVWPFARDQLAAVYRGHTDAVLGVAFGWAVGDVISVGTDRTLRCWDVRTEQEHRLHPFRGLNGGVLAHHPEGKRFARVASHWVQGRTTEATVHCFDGDGKPLWSQRRSGGLALVQEMSADGKALLVGYTQGALELFDVETGALRWSHAGDKVRAAVFDRTGQRVAVVGHDGVLRLRESASGRELLRLERPSERPVALAFSADGQQLITASDRGLVQVRRADTGSEVRQLHGVSGLITVVKASPDGRWIAGANSSGGVGLWEAESGTQARLLKGHADQVNTLAFTARGDRLVSGSRDGTVKMWRTDVGHELLTLHGERTVNELWFWGEERQLVGVETTGAIRIWDRGR